MTLHLPLPDPDNDGIAPAVAMARPTACDPRALNALRHGVLSRKPVLPWESATEYEELRTALIAEHRPEGPTEAHLVEEIAFVIWRRRRLVAAEVGWLGEAARLAVTSCPPHLEAAVRAAMEHGGYSSEQHFMADQIAMAEATVQADRADHQRQVAAAAAALAILQEERPDAFGRALAALDAEARRYWWDHLAAAAGDPDAAWSADADSLGRWLRSALAPSLAATASALAARDALRGEVAGRACAPDERTERLTRYEGHLDRKLERTLSMLLRLQELRRTVDDP